MGPDDPPNAIFTKEHLERALEKQKEDYTAKMCEWRAILENQIAERDTIIAQLRKQIDDDDDFTVTKRKHKSIRTKSPYLEPIAIHNKYAALSTNDDNVDMEDEQEQTPSASQMSHNQTIKTNKCGTRVSDNKTTVNAAHPVIIKKPPPITVTATIVDYSAFHTQLKRNTKTPSRVFYNKTETKIYPQTEEDHANLTKYFTEEKVNFFTHAPRSANTKRITLKVPPIASVEEIKSMLREQSDTVDEVIQLPSRTAGRTSNTYLVNIKKEGNLNDIKKITYLDHSKVRWQKYNKARQYSICHRCQQFGHGARYCNNATRCVKCIGHHLTSDCKKTEQQQVQCTNCKGPHPASYTMCPSYLRYIEERNGKTQNNTRRETPPPPQPMQINFPPLRGSQTSNNPPSTSAWPQPTTTSNSAPDNEFTRISVMYNRIKNEIYNAKSDLEKVMIFHKYYG
jgi:hypothetical protein